MEYARSNYFGRRGGGTKRDQLIPPTTYSVAWAGQSIARVYANHKGSNNRTLCYFAKIGENLVAQGGSLGNGMVRISVANPEVTPSGTNYTTYYNSWLYSNGFEEHSRTETFIRTPTGFGKWRCKVSFTNTMGVLTSVAEHRDKKLALTYACAGVFAVVEPVIQMERNDLKESDQGLTIQDSDKQASTIITRDEGVVETTATFSDNALTYLSSEPVVTFENVTNKWMPLPVINITTAMERDKIVNAYFVPETFIKALNEGVVSLPFRAFIYSHTDFAMKFVVNANRFQCGKVVASVKFDSYQADEVASTVASALQRPHVVLDLATNNEGILEIPFRFRRGMIRNVFHESSNKGVKPAKYATVTVHVLSSLSTGAGGATDMNIRPYVMMRRAEFAGVSYQVSTQMDVLSAVTTGLNAAGGLKELLGTVEKFIEHCGDKTNMDKPTDLRVMSIVPRARLTFNSGKGPVDSIPMRMNPASETSSVVVRGYPDEPKTTLDIARIWGLRMGFKWAASKKAGEELERLRVDPVLRHYDRDYTGTPTPLEYIANMYNFWSGTIELRLDFVSNAFHTGAIMIACNFNRVPNAGEEIKLASTYTKIFHLGEQKSVTFVVPYIYDTVWRRNTSVVYTPIITDEASTARIRDQSLMVRPEVMTWVTVSVVNELNPTSTAPQEIEVLLYWRAGPDFTFHSLVQSGLRPNTGLKNATPALDNFPKDSYASVDRTKRSYEDEEWAEPTVDELVQVQMDNGEKEAQDPTQNFAHGRPRLIVQTNDNMMNIKDILRRPVLIIHQAILKGTNDKPSIYYIPIMPPSMEMQYRDDAPNNIFSQMVTQTPQAQLMSLFRFWRGTSRYTFVFGGPNSGIPIYITTVPHSGVRIMGEHQFHAKTALRPIYGSGLPTEIVAPIVNPTISLDVPFETENMWCLTFEEDARRNYCWRDKGDTVAGHLVVTTTAPVSMSVWWSAGDDFDFANFYGTPQVTSIGHDLNHNDNQARVQMDFKETEGSYFGKFTSHFGTLGANLRALPMGTYAKGVAATIPVLGSAVVAGEALRVGEKASQVLDNMNTVTHKVDHIIDQSNVVLSQMQPLCDELRQKVDLAIDQIMGKFAWSIDFVLAMKESLIDVFIAAISRSWMVVATTLIRIFCRLTQTDVVGVVASYCEQLAQWFALNITGVATTQAPSNQATMAGIICGILGMIYKVRIESRVYESVWSALTHSMTSASTMTYLNGVLRYIQSIFDLVKKVTLDVLGYVDPETHAVRLLSDSSPAIENFSREAQHILSDFNISNRTQPVFRQRCLITLLQAMNIQRALVLAPPSVVKPQLAKLCGDVLKFCNENMVDLTCSPARYEPFVICIEGAPGIGKSYLTQALATRLMADVAYNRMPSDLLYTRMPGSRFWSGYRDQPVVVYDDWLNLNQPELMSEQISELYSLKSTSTFIPQMADLADKKIKANPLLVLLLCNDAFPNSISNVAPHQEAVLRRRDIVIKAKLKPGITAAQVSKREVDLTDFAHLEFELHRDPSSRKARYHPNAKGWEEMVTYLSDVHRVYHAQRKSDMIDRLTAFRTFIAGQDIDQINIVDPFELFYTFNAQRESSDESVNWSCISELTVAAENLGRMLEENATAPPVVHVPSSPTNIFAQADVIGGSCYETLVAAIPTGFLTSTTLQRVMMDITAFGIHKLCKMVEWGATGVQAECVCCRNTVRCVYVCRDSLTAETPHYVCSECWSQVQQHGPPICPVCRSGSVALALNTQGSLMWTILLWMKEKVGDNLVLFLTKTSKLLGTRAFRMFYALMKVYTVYTMLAFGCPQLACLHTGNFIGESLANLTYDTFHDCADDLVTRAHVQMDSWDENRARILRTQLDNVEPTNQDPHARVVIRDDVIQELARHSVDPGMPCYHVQLIAQAQTARYIHFGSNGAWIIHLEIGGETVERHVPDGACVSNDCPFRQRDNIYTFLNEYLSINQLAVRKNISAYINHRNRREFFAGKIPQALRPVWMDKPDVLPVTPWWEWLGAAYDRYKVIINFCITAGVAVVGILGSMRVYASLFGSESTQGIYEGVTTRHAPRMRTPVRFRPRDVMQTQGSQYSDQVEQKVFRNYVCIKLWDGEVCAHLLIGIGVCERWVMIPKHYVAPIEKHGSDGKKITIEWGAYVNPKTNYLVHEYTYSSVDFVQCDRTDLALFRTPASFGLFKDIRKLFVTTTDLENDVSNTGSLLIPATRTRHFPTIHEVDILRFKSLVNAAEPDGGMITARDVICYSHSENGVCGSLLVLAHHTRPLVSMHVAGNTLGEGYGVVVTQELLHDIIPSTAVVQYEENPNLVPISPDVSAIIIDSPDVQLEYIGVVERKDAHYIPKKTSYCPSLIKDIPPMTSFTQPAILDKTDPRYKFDKTPLYYGIAKHGVRTVDFDSATIALVQTALWEGWFAKMRPSILEPKRFSYSEAVAGIPYRDFYDALKLNTSAGYPWSTRRVDTTKRTWINAERGPDDRIIGATFDPMLLAELERKEQLRRKGIVPFTIFADTLKDERREPEKLLAPGGTRVFCASPVDYTISCRQNYLHFQAAFMSSGFAMCNAVGINPHGSDWTDLFHYLTEFGTDNIVTLDYSNFGPGFNAKVALACSELMAKWTLKNVIGTSESELLALMYESVNSLHIASTTVYRQFCGSPSGASHTTIINSLVNWMYILVAWYELVGKYEFDPWRLFKDNVHLVVYGDDLIMGVSNTYLSVFNGETIHDYFAKYRISVSDATKQATLKAHDSIWNQTFLKRGFRKHPSLHDSYLSPLKWVSINDATQWIFSCSNRKRATYENINAALLEAHGHGPVKFNAFKCEINRALVRQRLDTITVTWEEIDKKWHAGEIHQSIWW